MFDTRVTDGSHQTAT